MQSILLLKTSAALENEVGTPRKLRFVPNNFRGSHMYIYNYIYVYIYMYNYVYIYMYSPMMNPHM